MSSKVLASVIARLREFRFKYRTPAAPFKHLGAEATQPVKMNSPNSEEAIPDGELFAIWKKIPEGHKWWHYFPVYEKILGSHRGSPIRLLEIGVYKGGSLKMWREYLHPESLICGLDIDSSCSRFNDPERNVFVRVGDQANTTFLREVFEEFGPFDVIIDDGSHVCSHMIKTFEYAFLNGLADQGMYIAEDTHSNFFPSHRDQAYSFIDLCKDLVDISHSHYVGHREWQFALGKKDRLLSTMVPRIGREIGEISFLDSVVIIKKDSGRCLPVSEHL